MAADEVSDLLRYVFMFNNVSEYFCLIVMIIVTGEFLWHLYMKEVQPTQESRPEHQTLRFAPTTTSTSGGEELLRRRHSNHKRRRHKAKHESPVSLNGSNYSAQSCKTTEQTSLVDNQISVNSSHRTDKVLLSPSTSSTTSTTTSPASRRNSKINRDPMARMISRKMAGRRARGHFTERDWLVSYARSDSYQTK
ncbi:uncharacterized protein [Apostichopus japonicus]